MKERGRHSVGYTESVFQRHFDRSFFKEFPKHKEVYEKTDLYEVRDKLFGLIAEKLIHQPNGVVLDGIGYLGFCCYQKKAKVGSITLFKSKGMKYEPCFFPVYSGFKLKWFLFFLNNIYKKEWIKAMQDGMQYHVYPRHIKNLIGSGRRKINTRNTRGIHS